MCTDLAEVFLDVIHNTTKSHSFLDFTIAGISSNEEAK